MISYTQALSIIDDASRPAGPDSFTGMPASGTVTGSITAEFDVPPHDNAAMDGYALRADDTTTAAPDGPVDLAVIAKQMAGDKRSPITITKGTAVEIATGARLPDGADTVVPVERIATTDKPGVVRLETPATRGANIRRTGEDIERGQELLPAGTLLEAHHQMLLAAGTNTGSGGKLATVRPPASAIIATGNEIGGGTEYSPVRDANSPYLAAALSELGVASVERYRVADEPDAIEARISTLVEAGTGLIITTGGVSVGQRDLIRGCLDNLGATTLFHGVAIRPGKPVLMAKKSDTLIFGLPGNPIAMAVCFRLFVVRALRGLAGCDPETALPARLRTPVRMRPSFSFFAKASATLSADATLEVSVLPGQESFKVAPLAHANCWACIRPGDGELAPGELVQVLPMLPGSFPTLAL
jgi:molybdopterin molybdotransferase